MKTLTWEDMKNAKPSDWRLIDEAGREIACIRRIASGWYLTINQIGNSAFHHDTLSSRRRARAAAEFFIDRRSIGMFNEDDIKFV